MSTIEHFIECEKKRLALFQYHYKEHKGLHPEFPDRKTIPEFRAQLEEFCSADSIIEEDEIPTEEERIRMHVEADEEFHKKFIKK